MYPVSESQRSLKAKGFRGNELPYFFIFLYYNVTPQKQLEEEKIDLVHNSR